MMDLKGQQIGDLTVIEYNPQFQKVKKSTGGEQWQGRWVCRCSCGNKIEVVTNRLKNKKTTSCGCRTKNKSLELAGKIFGQLTVQERLLNAKGGKTLWNCLCSCGNSVRVIGEKLTSGRQISCGCSRKIAKNLQFRNEQIKKSQEPLRRQFYAQILKFCTEHNLKFLLSLYEFLDLKDHHHDILRWGCLEKNHSFELTWSNLVQAPYCRKCHQYKSKGELELREFVLKHFPEVEVHTNVKYLIPEVNEVDIFIPHLKLAIEYNGLYWHTRGDKSRHLKKREELNRAGYTCFQINSDEWEFQRPIVESLLLSKLGKTSRKIYARHCKIKKLTQKEAAGFLRDNHLMGPHNGSRALGLYLASGEIVCCFTYKILAGKTLEISRFCSVLGSQVLGGLTKLLSYALKAHEGITEVISWVDLRYGNGFSLERNGFVREKVTLGWKWTNDIYTFNRLYCRANMDDRRLSQSAYATEMGLKQIYDAGQAKYVKKL
jgi:hypothetical protein